MPHTLAMKTSPLTIILLAVLGLTISCGKDSGPSMLTHEVTLGKDDIMSVTNMSPIAAKLSYSLKWAASAVQSEAEIPHHDRSFSQGNMFLKDLPAAMRFNANPPPFSADASRAVTPMAATNKYSEGDTMNFWVQNQDPQQYNENDFRTIKATLKVQGTYCNIWVDNAIDTLAKDDIKALAETFDKIHPYATTLLGYEYGGGEGGSGGIDGDTQIQILVHNITAVSPNVLGYFWGKDEYKQSVLDKEKLEFLKSNEMEIFYIDSGFLKDYPKLTYSTLIHEFQHMIHFNQKTIKRNKNSEDWFNEMLSMLAEDVIGPKIGILPRDDQEGPSDGHPIDERIPLFLNVYDWFGIDEWDGWASYSIAYAFGAYLIRNFGGPELIREMLFNEWVNQNSITQAIQKLTLNSYSFEYALEYYGEALVYSPASAFGPKPGMKSFNITETWSINGESYTAKAFDIYAIKNADFFVNEGKTIKYRENQIKYSNPYGPIIYPIFDYTTPGHSVILHKGDLNGSDPDLKVNCTYPSRTDIRLKVYK